MLIVLIFAAFFCVAHIDFIFQNYTLGYSSSFS